ncbi:MAG TPA: FMN-binding negative transcriptional regulator [Gammaproteobacteria bacterium]|nr:FMN-binding negative transcriptional regulator [Gammaproteobacteria bacterium]
MYTPRPFSEADPKRLAAFIRDNAFGTLVTITDGRPEASHIPFLFDSERRLLLGHLAAANPQGQRLAAGGEVLVMFQGPHGYISPTWYEHADVPTWNYTAAHVYGHPEVIEDETELRGVVDTLSAKYESQFEAPWQPVYPDKLLGAIVGFRIRISTMQGKFKLSQNRSAADRANVIRKLRASGRAEDAALARYMSDT